MIALLTVIGRLLALSSMGIGFFYFLYLYYFTKHARHLWLLATPPLLLGSPLLLLSAYDLGDTTQIPIFFLLQSIGLMFLTYWGKRSLRSRKDIATTGEFEPDFRPPSEGRTMIRFFGQAFEDLAKPIVAVQGEYRLNQTLRELSKDFACFAYSRFTNKGEFKLGNPAGFLLGGRKEDFLAYAKLLEALIEEFGRAGKIKDHNRLARLVRQKCGRTLSRHRDFLIDMGLLHSLAGGILTDRVSTGKPELDKALEGGLPQGLSVLLIGRPSTGREDVVRSFLRAGLYRGDDCLVVSSTRGPDAIRSQFAGEKTGKLEIVDCHTSRFSEVPVMETRGDTILSPVALPVVDYAVGEGLSALASKRKRVVVDIITTYINSSTLDDLYPYLLEMISKFRERNCTAIFIVNPSALDERTHLPVLEEAFDCVLTITEEEDGAVIRSERLGFELRGGIDSIRKGIRLNPPDRRRPFRTPWSEVDLASLASDPEL